MLTAPRQARELIRSRARLCVCLGLIGGNPGHLELALDHREGHLAFNKIERILAKLLITPAFEDRQVAPHPGGEQFEIIAIYTFRDGLIARVDFAK